MTYVINAGTEHQNERILYNNYERNTTIITKTNLTNKLALQKNQNSSLFLSFVLIKNV